MCCGANEAPRTCGNTCSKRNCSSKNLQCKFLCETQEETCDCIDGYRRNDCGKCVKEDECNRSCKHSKTPKCFGPNETPDGCFDSDTELTCSNLDQRSERMPSKGLCILGKCHCADGFVRNKCGECVDVKDCDRECGKKEVELTQCSGPNESPVECYKQSSAKQCSTAGTSTPYFKSEKCEKGKCDCIEGYLRNKNGVCVPEEDCNLDIPEKCSNPCTKNNEIYRCLNGCLKRTCENIGIKALCLDQCIGGCDCVEGYRRDDGDECIPEKECPKSKKIVNQELSLMK